MCLPNEANLPKHLWGKLSATVVYLINRLLDKAIGGDSPYYRMFGKQADLSYSRTIGTRAFVVVECYTKKLQARPWEGFLIGNDNDKPTFRVYDRHISQVTSSGNVSFIEETPTAVPTTGATGGMETKGTEVSDFDSDDTIDNDATSQGKNDFSNSTVDKIGDTACVSTFSMRPKPSSQVDNGEQDDASSTRTTLPASVFKPARKHHAEHRNCRNGRRISTGVNSSTEHFCLRKGLTSSEIVGRSHAQGTSRSGRTWSRRFSSVDLRPSWGLHHRYALGVTRETKRTLQGTACSTRLGTITWTGLLHELCCGFLDRESVSSTGYHSIAGLPRTIFGRANAILNGKLQ